MMTRGFFSYHWTTTGKLPFGYIFESNYTIYESQTFNTIPIYECLSTNNSANNFISKDATCDGHGTYQRRAGYVYENQININTAPIFLCFLARKSTNDYFISSYLNCESQVKQYLIGYYILNPSTNTDLCCK